MSFTRQQAPLGLGHAVWCARDIVGNEPFAVVLPDELVLNTPGCLKQMIEAASRLGEKSNVIAVEEVPAHLTHQYGICGVGKRTGKMFEVDGMVEKPAKGTAPSNLSITGRYILQPEIFKILETQERGAGGEIQLTDAMIGLAKTQSFYGVEFEGERHDCGSKAGFLRANIAFGMARADLRDGLREEMKKHLAKYSKTPVAAKGASSLRNASPLSLEARKSAHLRMTAEPRPPAKYRGCGPAPTGCGRRPWRRRAPCRRPSPGSTNPGSQPASGSRPRC